MKPGIQRWRLIFLLLLAVFLAACSKDKFPPLPKDATVLVLGDSLSYGNGAAAGEDFPTLLAQSTGWQVINAGVPGDTSADGLARLPQLLQEHTPQLLLVELGGNDFLRHVPRAETQANLRAILDQAKARGITSVLVGIPRFNLLGAAVGRLSDDDLYQQVADATKTPLIPDVIADVLTQESLKSDPIHPNAEGYRQVADGLLKALRELGFAI